MIRALFEYAAPASLDEATALLAARREQIAVLGGGTVLVQRMTLGEWSPEIVLDLRRLPLATVCLADGDLVIGARVSYSTLLASALVERHAPLLNKMAGWITGGAQIRNQGTIGGAACYANPASDVPACLLALEARMVLASASGRRVVGAAEFFAGAFHTARRPDELPVEIVVPVGGPWTAVGYTKQKHCASSWPIVTAACLADAQARFRIAIGGTGVCPYAIEPVRGAREGIAVLFGRIAGMAEAGLSEEWSDELAPPGYRRRIAGAVAVRAVQQAIRVGAK